MNNLDLAVVVDAYVALCAATEAVPQSDPEWLAMEMAAAMLGVALEEGGYWGLVPAAQARLESSSGGKVDRRRAPVPPRPRRTCP